VINTNLHPISHLFQVIADHWSNLRFRQLRVGLAYLSSTHSFEGEPLNSRPRNLASRRN